MINCLNLIFNFLIKNSTEIRNWTQFTFIVTGGYIALKTYLGNNKQRKIDNSFKIIAFFKESIEREDISRWIDVFIHSSEPYGAIPGHYVDFINEQKTPIPFSELFDQSTVIEQGAIRRISEQFNLIAYEALYGNIELRLVYFEFGQIMDTVYDWLSTIEASYNSEKEFIEEYYPYFNRMYIKYRKYFEKWDCKTYIILC